MSQMHHSCHQFLHRNRTSNRDCRVVEESEFLVREAPASLQMAHQDTSHVVCYFYLYHPDWSYKNNSLYNDPFLPSIPLGHRMEDSFASCCSSVAAPQRMFYSICGVQRLCPGRLASPQSRHDSFF